MNAITITLPWPSTKLSLNVRSHWAVRSAATRKARRDAFYATCEAAPPGVREAMSRAAGIRASAVFTPPVQRNHDQTNLQGRMKAYEDGIVDAIGIDDSRWQWSAPVVTAPKRPGCVVVTIEPVEAAS